MVDPRFFNDEGHAGRRLMERVAQRSFKYNDEFSSEFNGFFVPVTAAFNELNALAIEDAQPFGMALAGLEYSWDEQDQRDLQNRRQLVEALHFAEERQEAADQIAFDLSARSDLDSVPGVVLDFLYGPWSLAMAHARLSDQRNQVDPCGFGSVVPDLLWSVKREATLRRPGKLIAMIPGLLDKLNTGLAMLGQDPKENEKFFASLMQLHQPVLKLRRVKSMRDAEESGAMPLEPLEQRSALSELEQPASPEQRRAKAAEQPWMGREDLDAAGFEDTLPTAPANLAMIEEAMKSTWLSSLQGQADTAANQAAGSAEAEPITASVEAGPARVIEAAEAASALSCGLSGQADSQTQPAQPDTAIDQAAVASAEATLMSLRTGRWVDLYSKRRWLRAQLVWASAKGTLFMFVSHGGQPHSMTKRSCEKLLVQRLLRPVDSQGVVAQALDAVAEEAALAPSGQPKVQQAASATV